MKIFALITNVNDDKHTKPDFVIGWKEPGIDNKYLVGPGMEGWTLDLGSGAISWNKKGYKFYLLQVINKHCTTAYCLGAG